MNLFTGLRDQASFTSEDADVGGHNGIPQGRGPYGENYTHGFVHEKELKYRYGGLTLNYNGTSVGVNSEWVRHAFQNIFAPILVLASR
jgi:hypothetical protein